MSTRKTSKSQAVIGLVLVVGILILLNFVSKFIYTRFDLTEDKRFSLTENTKKMLAGVDQTIYIEVMLEGDFPSLFQRLRNSSEELLKQFHGINARIEYRFVNPLAGKPEDVKARQNDLKANRIYPINLNVAQSGERKEQLVYPYAKGVYGTRQAVVINLLENKIAGSGQEEIVNNSINLLEYKFANAIQKALLGKKPIIAFSLGHGEIDSLRISMFKQHLQPFYNVADIVIGARPSINYFSKEDTLIVDLLVVAKPTRPFSEQDKFKIDQYVMQGGKILWLLDGTSAEMDSLRGGAKQQVPSDRNLNLDDLLFKYGARVNTNLVLDAQCTHIPVVVGAMGNQAQTELMKWIYYPIAFTAEAKHPIVKSIDGVDMRFASTVDTISTSSNILKTPLLSSSRYSRIQKTPMRISMDILQVPIVPEKFNFPNQTMAVLLEGKFPSLFKNRISAAMDSMLRQQLNMTFIPESKPTRMIVVGDGDVAKTDLDLSKPESPKAMPLGYNQYERYTFGNKDFLLNCVEYLLDENGIIASRGREFKLRLLDRVKITEEKSFWQGINIALPLVVLFLFGLIYNYLRKRKYGSK